MFRMHDSAGWGWGWWFLMTIGMVAFWALVIYGIVRLVRGRPSAPGEWSAPPPADPPEEILKRRLARGEITVEEYERLHVTLARPPSPPPEREDHQAA